MPVKALTKILDLLTASIVLSIALFLNCGLAHAGSATLTWSAPSTNTDGSSITDLSGYRIYYGTSSRNYTQFVNAGNVNTYQFTNLTDGNTYYFALTTLNLAGAESDYSAEVSKAIVNTDVTGPLVSGVYTGGVSSSAATVNWTTNEASTTQVEYGMTTGYGYSTALNSTLDTVHSQAIYGLASSTLYHYRVKSRDAAGNTTVSGDYTFTTAAPVDATAPVISNVLVKDVTDSSATVTWSTDEPSTSQVEYGTSASYGTFTTADASLVTIHSVTVTGLSGNTVYNFRVRSSDGSGNRTIGSNQTFTTSNAAPAINGFTASTTSGIAALTVDFSASASDADGFIASYEWDFDGDGVYEQNTGAASSASHVYSTAGQYLARVRATDNGGVSIASTPVTINVSSAVNTPPAFGRMLASPATGATPLTVTFVVEVTDADGTIVEYQWDFDGNGTTDATTTTGTASYIYDYIGEFAATVKAVDNNGATSAKVMTISASATGTGGSSSAAAPSGGCFIATAAYGSYLEPQVVVLREFRDRYLLTNGPGSVVVDLYYRASPTIADYIARHDAARFAVRALLTPVVYGVEYPWIAFALAAMPAVTIAYRRRRKHQARAQSGQGLGLP